MGQERLSNISILNIERSRTHELNINKIIDYFANKKTRKKFFCKLFCRTYFKFYPHKYLDMCIDFKILCILLHLLLFCYSYL